MIFLIGLHLCGKRFEKLALSIIGVDGRKRRLVFEQNFLWNSCINYLWVFGFFLRSPDELNRVHSDMVFKGFSSCTI